MNLCKSRSFSSERLVEMLLCSTSCWWVDLSSSCRARWCSLPALGVRDLWLKTLHASQSESRCHLQTYKVAYKSITELQRAWSMEKKRGNRKNGHCFENLRSHLSIAQFYIWLMHCYPLTFSLSASSQLQFLNFRLDAASNNFLRLGATLKPIFRLVFMCTSLVITIPWLARHFELSWLEKR